MNFNNISNSADEKTKRVKYIRSLEKVAKVAISCLKRADFDHMAFRQRVDKNIQILQKVEPVYLDQPYTKALETFINSLLNDFSRDELLKMANLLEKLKNTKTYKKEKHKNKFKDDI